MGMHDDIIVNKMAIIERCVKRVKEEYYKDVDSFHSDYTRQDAAILNIQRACEAALDMGQHITRKARLGLSQSSRDVFSLLQQHNIITPELAENMKNMIGFRNIAVHAYQELHLPILIAIIEQHLDDLLAFGQVMIHLSMDNPQ